jgi:NADH dehydrogenase FAD-containing subunit
MIQLSQTHKNLNNKKDDSLLMYQSMKDAMMIEEEYFIQILNKIDQPYQGLPLQDKKKTFKFMRRCIKGENLIQWLKENLNNNNNNNNNQFIHSTVTTSSNGNKKEEDDDKKNKNENEYPWKQNNNFYEHFCNALLFIGVIKVAVKTKKNKKSSNTASIEGITDIYKNYDSNNDTFVSQTNEQQGNDNGDFSSSSSSLSSTSPVKPVNSNVFKNDTNTNSDNNNSNNNDKSLARRSLSSNSLSPLMKSKFKKELLFKSNKYYQLTRKKKVVVIGGGFAGLSAAKQLHQLDFDVTLISASDYFENVPQYIYLVSDPSAINRITAHLPSSVSFEFIESKVISVSKKCATLENGEVVDFDYLIVATGNTFHLPIKPEIILPSNDNKKLKNNNDKVINNVESSSSNSGSGNNNNINNNNDDELNNGNENVITAKNEKSHQQNMIDTSMYDGKEFRKRNVQIVSAYESKSLVENYSLYREAKKIVVVGSGPVAIEMAGEFAFHYPNTSVYVISRSESAIARTNSAAHQSILKTWSSLKNLKTFFGMELFRIEGRNISFTKLKNVNDYETIDQVDILVPCLGFTPRTELFSQFMSHCLNPKTKLVNTNEYFQVLDDNLNENENENEKKYISNIFAIGDIVDSTEERLARIAIAHGNYISNYLHEREKSNKNPEKYNLDLTNTILLSVGKNVACYLTDNNAKLLGKIMYKFKSFVLSKLTKTASSPKATF